VNRFIRFSPLLIFCLFFLALLLPATEAEAALPVLRDVSFYGCQRSSPVYLLEFLDLEVGATFDEAAVRTVRQRLLTLGMFKGVEVEKRILEGQVFLIISVEEHHPFILVNEIRFNAQFAAYPAEENELYYLGATVRRVDFSGGRKSLTAHAGLGSQDLIILSFGKQTPWQGEYGADIGFVHYNSSLFEIKQSIDKGFARFFLSKKWLHFSLRWWAEFDRLRFPARENEDPHQNLFSTFWRSGLRAGLDLRDHPFFPRQGLQLDVGAYRTWQEAYQVYDALTMNLSIYAPALSRDHSLALNFSGHLTSGSVPLFDRFSLGGSRVLRGQKAYEQTGSQALWGGVEYRIAIGNFNTGQNLLIASSLYLFADAGVVGEKLKAMFPSRLQHCAGIGFFWQLGRENTIRFDFTLSPKFRFTIGTGWKI
jgi:outer membrane protein assembly factor BamA